MVVRFAGVIVAALAMAACSAPVDDDSPAGSEPSATTAPAAIGQIVVRVELPAVNGILVGPANGHVTDDNGKTVAEFEFQSGWVLPDQWGVPGDTPTRSDAPSVVNVELPEAGSYTFTIDEYGVSNNPCGTCEQGYAGGSIRAAVEDGDVVVLPAGDPTWVS